MSTLACSFCSEQAYYVCPKHRFCGRHFNEHCETAIRLCTLCCGKVHDRGFAPIVENVADLGRDTAHAAGDTARAGATFTTEASKAAASYAGDIASPLTDAGKTLAKATGAEVLALIQEGRWRDAWVVLSSMTLLAANVLLAAVPGAALGVVIATTVMHGLLLGFPVMLFSMFIGACLMMGIVGLIASQLQVQRYARQVTVLLVVALSGYVTVRSGWERVVRWREVTPWFTPDNSDEIAAIDTAMQGSGRGWMSARIASGATAESSTGDINHERRPPVTEAEAIHQEGRRRFERGMEQELQL